MSPRRMFHSCGSSSRRGRAQEAADRAEPVVVRDVPASSADSVLVDRPQRAELQQLERPAVQARRAPGGRARRARPRAARPARSGQQDRRQHDQGRAESDDVERRRLSCHESERNGRAARPHQRHAPDLVHVAAGVVQLEQPRDEEDLDVEPVAGADDVDQVCDSGAEPKATIDVADAGLHDDRWPARSWPPSSGTGRLAGREAAGRRRGSRPGAGRTRVVLERRRQEGAHVAGRRGSGSCAARSPGDACASPWSRHLRGRRRPRSRARRPAPGEQAWEPRRRPDRRPRCLRRTRRRRLPPGTGGRR